MTTKRVPKPSRDYSHINWATAIPEAIATGNAKQWCAQLNIEYRTFKRRRAEWERCGHKDEYKFVKHTNDNKVKTSGGTRQAAYNRFVDMYVVTKKQRSNDTVMQCMQAAYAERHPECSPLKLDPSCAQVFKREFDLVDYVPVYRSANKAAVPDSVLIAFQNKLRVYMSDETLDKDLIINADSTTFNCINPSRKKVVSPRGQQAEVDQQLNTNHRIVLHNGITAAGSILQKWYVIAHDAHFQFSKAHRSLRAAVEVAADYDRIRSSISVEDGATVKIKRDAHGNRYVDQTHTVRKHNENFVDMTAGGGLTQASLIKYIDAVILPHTRNRRCVLLLDAASINHSEKTWAKVRRHNIELLEIPANCTQWLQPNDVTVFGPAKKKLRAHDDAQLERCDKPDLRRAMTAMSMCIDAMQPKVAGTFTYVCDSPCDVLRRNKIKTKSRLLVRSASAPF